jgi:hypothetical protein
MLFVVPANFWNSGMLIFLDIDISWQVRLDGLEEDD